MLHVSCNQHSQSQNFSNRPNGSHQEGVDLYIDPFTLLYSNYFNISMSKRRTRSDTQAHPPERFQPSHQLELENPTLSQKLIDSSLHDQTMAVVSRFTKKYPTDNIKDEQIKTVVSLMNGDNTFLLAGTGFGKSRVPELFFHMFRKGKKPVILVLNPLDSLGDNQVNA